MDPIKLYMNSTETAVSDLIQSTIASTSGSDLSNTQIFALVLATLALSMIYKYMTGAGRRSQCCTFVDQHVERAGASIRGLNELESKTPPNTPISPSSFSIKGSDCSDNDVMDESDDELPPNPPKLTRQNAISF